MIKFDQLVHAIHAAALNANKAIANENIRILKDYFEYSLDSEMSEEILSSAIEAAKELPKDDKEGIDNLTEILKRLTDDASKGMDLSSASSINKLSVLRPKTITLECPEPTDDGVRMKKVKVPLIALAPVTLSEISEIKFKTELEVISDEQGLIVNFVQNKKPTEGDAANIIKHTTLEMTITPKDTTQGLKTIIAGYEKLIKAQMP